MKFPLKLLVESIVQGMFSLVLQLQRARPSLFRRYAPKRTLILGIESSCDDSAAALISSEGKLLGESISTQLSTRFGGVIPSMAMGYHSIALPKVVDETFAMANVDKADIDAIAITTKPGLSGSLWVGSQFAQYLSRKLNKPLIPIHHMEAHALTARMAYKIDFPFMVLLVSGGHCLLAIAQDINQFVLLGKSNDNSPGEILDKIARRLRLHTLVPELRDVSGGQALERCAKGGDPDFFEFPIPLRNERNCRFSWSGFKTHSMKLIERLEKENQVSPDELIPHLPDLCASVEFAMSKHLCRRVQRGFAYSDMTELWPDEGRTLVVSGGVGCNTRIRSSLQQLCDGFGVRLVAPEPKYCTDNGLMIAWNGLEKWRRNLDIVRPEDVFGPEMKIEPRASFGTDISDKVNQTNIKLKWFKIDGHLP